MKVNEHLSILFFLVKKKASKDGWELDKLYVAARQPKGYEVFVALLREPRWKPPRMLSPKINNYLRAYTQWKPERGTETRVNVYAIRRTFSYLTIQIRRNKSTLYRMCKSLIYNLFIQKRYIQGQYDLKTGLNWYHKILVPFFGQYHRLNYLTVQSPKESTAPH